MIQAEAHTIPTQIWLWHRVSVSCGDRNGSNVIVVAAYLERRKERFDLRNDKSAIANVVAAPPQPAQSLTGNKMPVEDQVAVGNQLEDKSATSLTGKLAHPFSCPSALPRSPFHFLSDIIFTAFSSPCMWCEGASKGIFFGVCACVLAMLW